jgi:FkbM family methyltransferase
VRILFVLKGLSLLRHFEDVCAELAGQGHSIVFASTKEGSHEPLPESIASFPNCTVVQAPRRRHDGLDGVSTMVRRARDYARYHEPSFWGAHANRRRALEKLLFAVPQQSRVVRPDAPDGLVRLNDAEVAELRMVFQQVEDLIPSAREIEQFVLEQRPDIVLVTPLVSLGGGQVEFVKAARSLEIPTAFPVFSWDNLSNKGVVHVRPDRVFVWNEIQRREAVELHGLDGSTVVVTGAPRFDAFYRRAPSVGRDTLCGKLRLDSARALVAYLASSPVVSPNEPLFVERWLAAIRAAPDLRVREAQLVIRPHPRHKDVWKQHPRFRTAWDAEPEAPYPGVALTVSKSVNADQDLFDLLTHADATVGLNTSAEIEAGILGKPVYTIRTPETAPGQGGSVHFHYLLASRGGFVELAETLEEHVGQLARGLRGEIDRQRQLAFVREFVRPRGDVPASHVLAREIVAFEAQVRAAAGRTDPTVPGAMAQAQAKPKPPARAFSGIPTQLEAESDIVRVDYPGAEIRLYASSHMEKQWRARACRKEPWTVQWLEESVQPGDVVYDIGANVGVFSLLAAHRCAPSGKVIAFEPGYASFARLCDNIVLNRRDDLIVPVPLPLSSATGLSWFTYRTLDAGQSGHKFTRGSPESARPRGRYTQPVLAVRLDELVNRFGLPSPTHVKLDVDGAELHVLEGAAGVLAVPTVRTLLAEIRHDLSKRVVHLLAAHGFQLQAEIARARDRKRTESYYGVFSRTAVVAPHGFGLRLFGRFGRGTR